MSNQSKAETKMITLPAGTHVIMELVSPLDTESAVAGAGVYLETISPVIVGDEVAIPAHSYVTGTIESDKRAGHVTRAASFRMHFTQMTLAGSGKGAAIDGELLSLPGSTSARLDKKSGKLGRVDQVDKALPLIGAGALGGAVIGSVRRFGVGTWTGAGLGAGIAGGYILLTRGDAIHLPEGTKVEMELKAPLMVPASSQANQLQLEDLVERERSAVRGEGKPSAASERPPTKPAVGRLLTQEILRGKWR